MYHLLTEDQMLRVPLAAWGQTKPALYFLD